MLYVYHCMSNNLFKSLAYELLPVLQLSDSFNVETYLVNQWLKYVCQRSYSIRWQQVLHRSLLPALYVYRCDTYCSQRSVSTCIATISLRLQLRSTSRSIMSWEKKGFNTNSVFVPDHDAFYNIIENQLFPNVCSERQSSCVVI